MKRVQVVAALIREGERVFVQQRRPGGARGLLWEFPGGKIEAGETPEQALARECREELDVEVEVGSQVARNLHTYSDLEVELLLYRCRIVDGELQALHANAVQFAPVELLPELPFCEADDPFIRSLLRGEY